MLAKERSKVEIVNDINGELVSLYRVAQWHLDALITEIEWTLASRQNLADFIAQPGLTEIQRAARFFLRNRFSFGGSGRNFAVRKATASPSRANVLDGLRALNSRLDKVAVENLPYQRLTLNYDSSETFWFFDPPYTSGQADNYDEWDAAKMRELASHLEALQGDWLLTVNDIPDHRRLFARHEIQAVTTRSGKVNQRLNPAATFGELIIRRRKAASVRMSSTANVRRAA